MDGLWLKFNSIEQLYYSSSVGTARLYLINYDFSGTHRPTGPPSMKARLKKASPKASSRIGRVQSIWRLIRWEKRHSLLSAAQNYNFYFFFY